MSDPRNDHHRRPRDDRNRDNDIEPHTLASSNDFFTDLLHCQVLHYMPDPRGYRHRRSHVDRNGDNNIRLRISASNNDITDMLHNWIPHHMPNTRSHRLERSYHNGHDDHNARPHIASIFHLLTRDNATSEVHGPSRPRPHVRRLHRPLE